MKRSLFLLCSVVPVLLSATAFAAKPAKKQQEAEKVVASTPQKLELFYDVALGAFAIDAEAVGNTPLYNPYTGKEIPDETK